MAVVLPFCHMECNTAVTITTRWQWQWQQQKWQHMTTEQQQQQQLQQEKQQEKRKNKQLDQQNNKRRLSLNRKFYNLHHIIEQRGWAQGHFVELQRHPAWNYWYSFGICFDSSKKKK